MTFLLRIHVRLFMLCLAALCEVSCGSGDSSGGLSFGAVGGFVEKSGSAVRPRLSTSEIQSFVPSTRGPFSFPAPYGTTGVRITDASDCGGADCVWTVGYSYWRNTNAHQGSNEMLIFLGLSADRGGTGPTLFKLDKTTDTITKVGPLFPAGSKFVYYSATTWYFSPTKPTVIYIDDGPQLLRYDVLAQQFETVFDITAQFGANRTVWQTHTSNDDLVHSATLKVSDTGEYLGCFVYFETTAAYRWYPKVGDFDECHLDRSGRWTVSQEIISTPDSDDMRIFDNQTGQETRISQPNGALGHLDMGYGYAVGANGYNSLPNATLLWTFDPVVAQGPVVHYNLNWNIAATNHVSHVNAKPAVPLNQQYACGSNADTDYAVQNEITCFRLDNSDDELIVAPVMTDLNASGGCCDTYEKYPKGNLDITGQYFIWTTNLGGGRLDAFLVKVPSQLLIGGGGSVLPAAPVNLRVM
jgi:hypothetical protein